MKPRTLCAWSVVLMTVVQPGVTPDAAQTARPSPSTRVGSLPLEVVTSPWVGDFDGIVQRRRLRLLTPYSRTHYFVDRGVQHGIVYDFGVRLEQEINRRLKTTPATKIHVVFVPTSRDQLYQSLIDGRGDVIASNLTITPDLASLLDFTIPGQVNVNEILVTGPGTPAIDSRDGLAGLEIAVRERSTERESLEALNAARKQQGLAPVVIKVMPAALEDEDVLEMVSAGLVKATVVVDVIAKFWAAALPGLVLHPKVVVREKASIAWAVRKGSPQLLAALNPIVAANRVGTVFGNTTLRTYLRGAKLVTRATGEAELIRFRGLEAIFRRYAQQYDLDHLLLMAQGYQESGLDQRATSSRGAIGIMQVMPATGVELKVGDIRQLEPNVHAGVKYIRIIIDRHLRHEPIDPINKTLFAFAAYNGGPGRLAQLRRQAQRRGLNPNVWFDNVESIAGEVVGRQTVDYVSSIYKYYVAYKLAGEARDRLE